jgi:hypothetical protein
VILTARQLKSIETPEFSIDLGNGLEVIVRRPDLDLLVLKGLLPTPLLGEMVKMVGEWAGSDVSTLTEDVISASDKVLTFVNTYVCEAMVKPRVVMTKAEQDALGGDALLPSDLSLKTRRLIVIRCAEQSSAAREVVAAAKDFPENGSGEGTGSDVPAVPDPSIISG